MDAVFSKASHEQLAFIKDTRLEDSKLLATAGSGKTFSIIAKAWNLIESNVLGPNEIYMLTFSRQARHDFTRKVDKMHAVCINKRNIRTIDSFAKYIIDQENKIDRSILSYTLREFLRDNSLETLKTTRCLDEIKFLFIDEAQDLNKTQYDVICLLRDRLGVVVNLVGDPNQNIYQFRGGCDRYLVDFPGRVYELTTNYRSFKHLVQFSNPLRRYKEGSEVKWTSESSRPNAKVTLYGYETNAQYEGLLIALVNKLRARIPLHKIAILSPTRGYLGKQGNHKGLCYVANLLHIHNIPAQLLYDDSADKNTEGGRECEERDGYLTLMTYTSSKGLEWEYVILVDANAYLISKKNYCQARFEEEQYLLYVASTRAKKGMYIFARANEANPWLDLLEPDTFHVFNPDKFNIMPRDELELKKEIEEDPHTHIPSIVYSLGEETLYRINRVFDAHVVDSTTFLSSTIQNVENNRIKFVQRFLRLVFQDTYASLHKDVDMPTLIRVESIMNDNNIIFCDNAFIANWFESNKEDGWESYQMQVRKGRVPMSVLKFVDEHISRNKEMKEYILVSDRFYNTYILENKEMIARKYSVFLKNSCITVKERLEILLYLSALDYAIATMHYFYINEYMDMFGHFISGANEHHLLNLVKSIESVPLFKRSNISVQEMFGESKITGTIDYLFDDHAVFLHFSMSPELRLQDCLNFLLHDYFLHKGAKTRVVARIYNLALGTMSTIEAVMNEVTINLVFKI